MTEFLAAMFGAVVGGVASLGGSVLVNRREVVRSARVRIHDELVPDLIDALGEWPPMSPFSEVLRATRRAAVLAGKPAVALVDEIHEAHETMFRLWSREGGTTAYGERVEPDDGPQARVEVADRVRALVSWVEGKIL